MGPYTMFRVMVQLFRVPDEPAAKNIPAPALRSELVTMFSDIEHPINVGEERAAQ